MFVQGIQLIQVEVEVEIGIKRKNARRSIQEKKLLPYILGT